MRLLHTTNLKLYEFFDEDIPEYAILSHTWRDGEVSFADFAHGKEKGKDLKGYPKIKGTCDEAIRQGLEHVWIYTVCIDKSSSLELSEAINSMFMWYKNPRICFVYLDDVNDLTNLGESRWIIRGWTLQELIAPPDVDFYSRSWTSLGSRESMAGNLARITNIDQAVLQQRGSLEKFNIATRMTWAAKRNTRRGEDKAYCLMGKFNVNMPIMYGEAVEKAFYRLQEAILETSDDHSILAWNRYSIPPPGILDLKGKWGFGFLAPDPWYFDSQRKIITLFRSAPKFTLTKRGLEISLPILYEAAKERGKHSKTIAILNCRFEGYLDGRIGVQVDNWGNDEVADEAEMFTIRNLPLVYVNVERCKKAKAQKIALQRQSSEIFMDGGLYHSRHICSVRSKPLLAQGYEVVHAEPECAVNSWNSHTHVSEVMAPYFPNQTYREFGFVQTAKNEAFIVSLFYQQVFEDKKIALRVEAKPLVGDSVTWLRSKGMYNVAGPSSPAEDWIQEANVRDFSQRDIVKPGASGEWSLLVRKQKLSSDASSSVTVEVKFVANFDEEYLALELSLTKRVHYLHGKKSRT